MPISHLPPKGSEDPEKVQAVFRALENPKFKWRTVNGISRECGIPNDDVLQVISKYPNEIIQSSVASTTGDVLYTTRRHYHEKSSFLDRLSSDIQNRTTT